ncbi:nucleoside-diphosphate kinase [Patescibacteria group bacterium]
MINQVEHTVVLIKPDGVRKKIVGQVIERFERVGLKLVATKMIMVDKTFVGKHYQDDDDYNKSVGVKTLENYNKYGMDPKENLGTKDPIKIGQMVRKWNMEFLSSGPVFAILLEGPGAINLVRKIVGNTFPADALPGTVRGDYALDSAFLSNMQKRTTQNIVHASGSTQEAEFERKLWFKEDEIFSY